METFTWIPSPGSGAQTRPRVLKAQFGDGYEQRTGDGPNSILQAWPLQFNNISKALAGEIETFLRARAGYQRFFWTPPAPHNTQKVFVCEEWNLSYLGGDVCSLSAVFLQRPAV